MTRAALFLGLFSAAFPAEVKLPDAYFPLLEASALRVQARLDAEPEAGLKQLESSNAWRHFGYAILPPAVLWAKQHPANPHYKSPRMRDLAIRVGDLLAAEDEKGNFEPRLDSDWDVYCWLEAWRLLSSELGDARRDRWRKRLEANVALLEKGAIERLDFAWYQSPFIGTSPNHYAQWAIDLYLAGRLFAKPGWEQLGARILRRFAAPDEQSPDGYWGEHNESGPTPGYNHLTLTALAAYYAHSGDESVAPALKRSTDFHRFMTLLDGSPVDVINDRNRRWGVSAWGQFAFANFPEGRGYAAFLASFFKPESVTVDQSGRLAQDALFYREGPSSPAPQNLESYVHRMHVPAGIRKKGPWQVALSGIISTPAVRNQFYLDRQGHVTVMHANHGMIVTGANSKRQPELATFSEGLLGQRFPMPVSSRLRMGGEEDRLSLAYNSFFSDLYVRIPSERELSMRFVIAGIGRPAEDPKLTLQLCLRSGEVLETGSGARHTLGRDRLELDGAAIAGSIRHRGWTVHVDPSAQLSWPVYPFNPYANGPETDIAYAVGALSVPLKLKAQPGRYVRPGEQTIEFRIAAP